MRGGLPVLLLLASCINLLAGKGAEKEDVAIRRHVWDEQRAEEEAEEVEGRAAEEGLLQEQEEEEEEGRRSRPSALGNTTSSRTGLKSNFPWYHTSQELDLETRRLVKNCGGAASMKTVKKGGVALDVITVKKEDGQPKSKVFMLFGEHSRELISPESGLQLLKVLCGEASAGESGGPGDEALTHSEFQLVLNGNPRSRLEVETGKYCLRENPHGVDLNRNWDEKWQPNAAVYADASPGPHPFSEPETQILKGLVTEYRPTAFLTVHSGTRGMYMPWAYDTEHVANRNERSMMQILKRLDQKHCQCPFGAAGKEVGYACPGTCLDWVYDHLKAEYSFAFEIYTNPEMDDELHSRWQEKVAAAGSSLLEAGEHLAHPHFLDFFQTHASDFVQVRQKRGQLMRRSRAMTDYECFDQFNPKTEKSYKAVISNWAGAYLEMAKMVSDDMKRKSTMTA